MQATWNGQIIAESDETVVIEGNHYFPVGHVDASVMQASDKVTHCPWKGDANYFTLTVDGQENPDAAWIYKRPKPSADVIEGRIAFWNGVEVAPAQEAS